ncbi:UNVERIFIED_CONTAM: hypothetical protein GTU68_000221, partial [Idotea baltica]|nr:hypothetical protein [Idotea baltica]
HSDKTQEERTQTLREFKNKQFRILVGTDVLARGIDIDNLSHVVNFDVPRDAEDYVHRVGRTARANTTGEAITFINPRDQGKFSRIEKLIEKEIPKPAVPEELGETPRYAPRKGGGGDDRRRGGGGGGNRRREGRGGRNLRRNGSGNQSKGQSNNRNRNRKRRPGNNSQGSGQNNGQQGQQNKPENGAVPKADQEGVKKRKSRNRRRKRKKNPDSTTPQAVNEGTKPSQD